MPLKNKTCTTQEPKAGTTTPTCPGTVIPVEFPIQIGGVTYARYEICQRCGKLYPG